MIIIQILSGILLIPFTLLMVFFFNLYIKHWLYLLALTLCTALYASIWGLTLANSQSILWIGFGLMIMYGIRLSYLALQLRKKNKAERYPLVRGRIKNKAHKVNTAFIFPLAGLRLIKMVPGLNTKQTNLGIPVSQVVDRIMHEVPGTHIEVNNNDADIFFAVNKPISQNKKPDNTLATPLKNAIKNLKIVIAENNIPSINITIPVSLAEMGLKLLPKKSFKVEGQSVNPQMLLTLIKQKREGELLNVNTIDKGKKIRILISIE